MPVAHHHLREFDPSDLAKYMVNCCLTSFFLNMGPQGCNQKLKVATTANSTLICLAALLLTIGWSLGSSTVPVANVGVLAEDSPFDSRKVVPFVPTPQRVVDKMIELAGVKKGDVVYDLGSGDGRIVIAAAKRGARAVGFEIDPELVGTARANIKNAGVEERAEIRNEDILTAELSGASVITLYLLPDVNLKLKPRLLRQLKPGSRVVSHAFDMGDWKPEKIEQVDGRTLYLWIIPANKR